jgi:hypothetical protein
VHAQDGFLEELHVLRTRVQSIASLRAMRKFYDDGNIATAVADQKARRELVRGALVFLQFEN